MLLAQWTLNPKKGRHLTPAFCGNSYISFDKEEIRHQISIILGPLFSNMKNRLASAIDQGILEEQYELICTLCIANY